MNLNLIIIMINLIMAFPFALSKILDIPIKILDIQIKYQTYKKNKKRDNH